MKLSRHVVVTILLVAYALFMTFYFGLDILKAGQTVRFFGTVAAETVVITLAFFALRRVDNMRRKRREMEKEITVKE